MIRTPSATAVLGSDTVDSASTRVVPRGTRLRRSVTASPLVQTPSSTPMPTDSAAEQTRSQPRSWTLTEQTSGLPMPRCPHARTASTRFSGSGWIHRPVGTPISMPGTSARMAATASPT